MAIKCIKRSKYKRQRSKVRL